MEKSDSKATPILEEHTRIQKCVGLFHFLNSESKLLKYYLKANKSLSY